MSEQYNHGKNRDGFPLGISNIWQGKSLFGLVWKWSNRCGEGEENTFDAAVTAAEAALSPCIEVANNDLDGDHRIVIWRNPVTGLRHAETNGDPIWEESSPEDFAIALSECGIIERGGRVIHTDDNWVEHRAVVTGIDGDSLHLEFTDGSEGWEAADTVYAARAKDWLRVGRETEERLTEELKRLAEDINAANENHPIFSVNARVENNPNSVFCGKLKVGCEWRLDVHPRSLPAFEGPRAWKAVKDSLLEIDEVESVEELNNGFVLLFSREERLKFEARLRNFCKNYNK